MKLAAAFLAFASLALCSHAKIVTENVSYDHAGVKLAGYLAYDDAKTSRQPSPGILIVPEWWGVNDYVKGRAEKIAALGYVAFVADMYGDGVSTTDPKKAGELASAFYGKPLMAERARAGLDRLLSEKRVDAHRVAVIGYCFGGTTAQALAYSGAPVIGMVSFHGGPITASPEAAAHNKAKFLICHGAADPFVKKEALDAFLKSLEDGKFDYQFISYAHAVHAFTNPGADKFAAAGLNGVGYNAAADHRSWEHMKLFLQEIFQRSE